MTPRWSRVLSRELRLASGDRSAIAVTATFVMASTLLAGLAFGPDRDVLEEVAPGTVWLVTLLSAAPQAREVSSAERAEGSWDLLRSLTSPTALLIGKIGGLWIRLLGTWALTAALVVIVLGLDPSWRAVVAGVLGTLGLATLLVALGTMVTDVGSGANALLTTLALPLALPILLAGAELTAPDVPTGPWLVALLGIDLVLIATVWGTFPTLLEE